MFHIDNVHSLCRCAALYTCSVYTIFSSVRATKLDVGFPSWAVCNQWIKQTGRVFVQIFSHSLLASSSVCRWWKLYFHSNIFPKFWVRIQNAMVVATDWVLSCCLFCGKHQNRFLNSTGPFINSTTVVKCRVNKTKTELALVIPNYFQINHTVLRYFVYCYFWCFWQEVIPIIPFTVASPGIKWIGNKIC